MTTMMTPNAVRDLLDSKKSVYIVQVLDVKKVVSPNATTTAAPAPDRWRLILSDGEFFTSGMLATQLNALVNDGQIKQFTFLRIEEFLCNQVQGKNGNGKIGNPVTFDSASKPSGVTPAQAPQYGNAYQAPQDAYQQPTPQPYQPMKADPVPAYQQPSYSTHSYPPVAPYGSVAPGPSSYGTGGQLAHADIVPLVGCSPYATKGTIQVRCLEKGDIKHYTNAKGPGKLMNVDLCDETAEIRCTMFNDAVDRFEPIFRKDGVYRISRFEVKLGNPRFLKAPQKYDMGLNSSSIVEPVDASVALPPFLIDPTPIAQLSQMDVQKDGPLVDVIGVMTSAGDVQTLTHSTRGEPMSKRTITLVDQSGASIDLTLWHKHASTHDYAALQQQFPVIACKGVKLGDYNGRTLSSLGQSKIEVDPAIPEASAVKQWYQQFSSSGAAPSTLSSKNTGGAGGGMGGDSKRKTFSQVNSENLGSGTQPEYYTARCVVGFIKPDAALWYPACPKETCNKKVNMEGDQFYCPSCNEKYPTCNYRYMLSFQAQDFTGMQWLTAFDKVGADLMGRSAADLNAIKMQDQAQYEDIFEKLLFKPFIVRVGAKTSTYQDETRVKHTVFSVTPVDFVHESKWLLESIKSYGM